MSHIRNIASHPRANSLWVHTADTVINTPPLSQSLTADVLVIGAGYTGLSTALHLAQSGASVVVLEAFQPGWGASGRNGGQVNPTLKHDPSDLHRLYGDKAEKLINAVSSSADLVFDLIKRYNINCDPVRSGWIQASYTESGTAGLYKRAEQWRSLGIPVKDLNQAETQKRTGSKKFKGGWLDTRAGSVQPLSYVCGLAGAAQQHGAQIFGNTPVSKLEKSGGKWVATVAGGARVESQQVVIATNGYTDTMWPNLAKTLLSANSFMAATTPLGERASHIFSNGETMSTAQRLLLYLRKDRQGRLIIGGRGKFADPESATDFAHLERSLSLLYPELAPFTFEYHWAGRIGITRDFMPHVHQPEPGITIALGYNGRGIATGTAMGMYLAALLAGEGSEKFPFPITPISKIPLHSWQRFYITAGVAWYSMLDRVSAT